MCFDRLPEQGRLAKQQQDGPSAHPVQAISLAVSALVGTGGYCSCFQTWHQREGTIPEPPTQFMARTVSSMGVSGSGR